MPAAPKTVRVSRDRRALTLVDVEGSEERFEAEMLRVFSPSAEVQGHSPSERKVLGGKRDVAIVSVQPVGHYALRIGFDDGHDSGIYSWAWFAALAAEKDARWERHLAELEERGLTR